MLVSHLYDFFGEISNQIFGPLLDWVLFVFVGQAWSCMSYLCILDINLLLVTSVANIFSHFMGWLFCFLSDFVYFCFYFFCLRRLPQENIATTYVKKCSAFVSSRSFMVSSLLFKSLKHFVFIVVYGVKECSKLIVWQIAVRFSQDSCLVFPGPLLKRLSFLHCVDLCILCHELIGHR